jgi:hypothetical protein
MSRIPRPRPMSWRQLVDLLAEVDLRLRMLLDSRRRLTPMVRAELEGVVALIEPVLVREGRRTPPAATPRSRRQS